MSGKALVRRAMRTHGHIEERHIEPIKRTWNQHEFPVSVKVDVQVARIASAMRTNCERAWMKAEHNRDIPLDIVGEGSKRRRREKCSLAAMCN